MGMQMKGRRGRKAVERQGMSMEELLELPISVDMLTAFRAVGIGRTSGYELVRTGQFPTRVLRLGNTYRVPREELLRLLGIDRRSREHTQDRPDVTKENTGTSEAMIRGSEEQGGAAR